VDFTSLEVPTWAFNKLPFFQSPLCFPHSTLGSTIKHATCCYEYSIDYAIFNYLHGYVMFSLNCIVSNSKLIMNEGLGRIWKEEWSSPSLKYCSCICLKELKTSTEILSWVGWDFKCPPPEHKSEVLLLERTCLVGYINQKANQING
jgi:hypothetical protein